MISQLVWEWQFLLMPQFTSQSQLEGKSCLRDSMRAVWAGLSKPQRASASPFLLTHRKAGAGDRTVSSAQLPT